MADYIHEISPDTLVSTGMWYHHVERYVPDAHLDFIMDEGPLDRRLEGWCEKAPLTPVPVVWTGYQRLDDSGSACGGSGWSECVKEEALHNTFTWIREGFLCGFQPSTPFWEYKNDIDADLDPYILEVRAFLDAVETWEDEPGGELIEAEFPAVP